jgi:uroporphyrinogen-III synthase
MVTPSFHGFRVLAFESRRATELAALISNHGGHPLMAPALREVPLESNSAAFEFAAALLRDEFDVVIFLTGVGTRALVSTIAGAYPREAVVAALARTKVVARGPKPLAVLRELQVPIWVAAPEPNTWRELVAAIDARVEAESLGHGSAATQPGTAARDTLLHDARIAVQEYGVSNPELLEALRARGARVSAVPVYRWALPENTKPLREAVTAMSRGEVEVILFTTSVQVVHLWQIVQEMQVEAEVRRGLARSVIASIGPTTSDELRRTGLEADLEASHPKIGFLVREAAARCDELLSAKRQQQP